MADSGYAALSLLNRCRALKQQATMVTRLRLDAALYGQAPARKPGQSGRPRKKGNGLPTLGQFLGDRRTRWTPIAVARWYSQGERRI